MLFGATVVLMVALIRQKEITAGVRTKLAETALDLQQADGRRAAFKQAVMRQELDGTFLEGTDVSTQENIRFDAPYDGIYYLVRRSCEPSAINLPILNDLYNEYGIPITVFSFDDASHMRAYVEEHQIGPQTISNARGKLTSLLPGNTTPVTIVVLNRRIQSITIGRIPDDMKVDVSRMTWSTRDTAR
jgi:hypothetical protein